MSQEDVVFNLELNVEGATTNVRKIETIIYRVLGLYNRICRLLGVPEDSPMVQVVQKAQKLTMIAREMTTAYNLMAIAQAGAGPVGWAMAGLGVAGVIVTSAEFMTSIGE